MDTAKRSALIERIKRLGLPSVHRPFPLVTLEEFFEGNDDPASIAANRNLPGPQFFYERLHCIRQRPDVQDVLVEVIEVEESDPDRWPYSDRVYIFTSASAQDVAKWGVELEPDEVEEGFSNGRPDCAPHLAEDVNCYSLWWD